MMTYMEPAHHPTTSLCLGVLGGCAIAAARDGGREGGSYEALGNRNLNVVRSTDTPLEPVDLKKNNHTIYGVLFFSCWCVLLEALATLKT